MATPYHHALSSVKKWGGIPEDYVDLHTWFDESKSFIASWQHRALRHHAEGIFMAERIFGPTILNSDGKAIPTRLIGEQHVMEDLGFIPTVADWLGKLNFEPWMNRSVKQLSHLDKEVELLNA